MLQKQICLKLLCASFELQLLGCVCIRSLFGFVLFRSVRSKAAFGGGRIFADALMIRMHVSSFEIWICYVQGMCRSTNWDSVLHVVFVDQEKMQVGLFNAKWTDVARINLILWSWSSVVGNTGVRFRKKGHSLDTKLSGRMIIVHTLLL